MHGASTAYLGPPHSINQECCLRHLGSVPLTDPRAHRCQPDLDPHLALQVQVRHQHRHLRAWHATGTVIDRMRQSRKQDTDLGTARRRGHVLQGRVLQGQHTRLPFPARVEHSVLVAGKGLPCIHPAHGKRKVRAGKIGDIINHRSYHGSAVTLKRQRPAPISSIMSMRAPPVYRRSTTPVRSLCAILWARA